MKINYDSVRRDAKKLRAVAEDCEAAAKTCSKYQNELRQYWQGSAADTYADGLMRLNKKNRDLARRIEQLSAQITSVANELEEEDRRLAAKIAAKRTAGAVSAAASAGKAVSKSVTSAVKAASSSRSSSTPKTNTSTLAQSVSSLLSRLFGKG